ncbi:BT_3987 domain-containing protein [Flavobacterium sp. W1B]|uniref:BT_3987 domain-containing protein n=1 Tax=Flavobacterium sp. W1B TaxID=3394146 RepID=UPI0039BCB62A
MKKRYLLYTTLLLVFGLYSCEKDTPSYEKLSDSKEGALVYTAKARNGIQTLKTFSFEEDMYLPQDTVSFNAAIGSLGLPASDIDVTYSINNRALDSINVIRELNGQKKYKPFPEDAYTISSLKLTIPKGKEYSNSLELVYNPEKFEKDSNYLIAFSIVDASGYTINPEVKTVIYAVTEAIGVPSNYTKTNWAVINFSTQESTGEGTNGFASLIIDGKLDTFWHSCWTCATAPTFPHSITVDMKNAQKVNGIEFAQRQPGAARAVKLIELEVSDDNVNWRTLGEFTLGSGAAPQSVAFQKLETFRYFKTIIKTGYNDGGAGYTALSEVSPYVLK